MRFLCIYKPAKAEGTPPTTEMMETMGKFIEQSFRKASCSPPKAASPLPLARAFAPPAAATPSPTAPSLSPKRSSAASLSQLYEQPEK
jgi:hypothetical protein